MLVKHKTPQRECLKFKFELSYPYRTDNHNKNEKNLK